jgi:hypothetical protein
MNSDLCLFSVLSLEQEHHTLCFTDFGKGFYKDKHPNMPGMACLQLKGSLVDKGNKIKGTAPNLYNMWNACYLVHNPNNILSPYHIYVLMSGFVHPDQEFMYCYKGNHKLLDLLSSLPYCHGFQMKPTCRIWKNSIGKVCAK